MKSKWLIVTWGYTSEILLSIMILILICLFYEKAEVTKFVINYIQPWFGTFASLMFTFVIGFIGVFYAISNTEFAVWLDNHNALKHYYKALSFAAFVFLMSVACSFIMTTKLPEGLAIIIIEIYIYSILNMITFFKNIYGLVMLNVHFKRFLQKNS